MKSWFIFAKRGWGLGRGLCPIPNLDFFEILVLIWCILEALRCRMLEIVTFLQYKKYISYFQIFLTIFYQKFDEANASFASM